MQPSRRLRPPMRRGGDQHMNDNQETPPDSPPDGSTTTPRTSPSASDGPETAPSDSPEAGSAPGSPTAGASVATERPKRAGRRARRYPGVEQVPWKDKETGERRLTLTWFIRYRWRGKQYREKTGLTD